MSQLPARVLDLLQTVGSEASEVYAERSYRVHSALDLDPAFANSNRPRSALTRSLIDDGVRIGASRAGVDCVDGRGGAVDLRFEAGGRYIVFRVKRGRRLDTGEIDILANSGSTWGIEDDAAIFPDEPWVLGYMTSEDGSVDLFVARVYGVTEGSPGHLILGPEIWLEGGSGPRGGGFLGDDDGFLPGFDDGEEETGEAGLGA